LGLIWFLIIGLIAGWLAGQLMKGTGYGLAGDLILGIVGAYVGSWVFALLGIAATGLVGQILCATAGAVLCVFAIRKLKQV
jgi:uncharacterized membrane protein YeaQ/YmgE (transglycosylase-associated protein family)